MWPAAHLHLLSQLLKKSLIPSPFLLQRLMAFCGLSPSRGQQATGAHSTHLHVHIMVGFLLGLGAPSGERSSWGSSHKKIKIYPSWCTDWLFQIYLWGCWKDILLFASPHCRMQGLTANSQLEHKLYFIFQSSSRKKERGKKPKSVFLMWSWGWNIFWKFTWEQYCFMGLWPRRYSVNVLRERALTGQL